MLCCCKKYLLVIGVVVGTTGVSNAGLDVLVLVEALECLFNTPINSSCEGVMSECENTEDELGGKE